MSNLWSGRFAGEPDPEVFEFGASFRFDRRLFDEDVEGSLAWAEALGAAGVVPADAVAAIVAGLQAIREEGRRNPAFVSGSDEDVHAFVERQLVARIGEAGKRLHTGRSRNEQVSLDLRLYLKRRIRELQDGLLGAVAILLDHARAAGDAVMPSYTHLRRAQPILVAHYMLSHAAALRRDVERFDDAWREADALPLGSGAIAGTSYPIDVHGLARRLGFSRLVLNSVDAASDRDFVSTFLHACSLTMVHLSRLAEDLILFTAEEFGFFELSDEVATGSSLMPQKKNPDPLELLRGKTGRVVGHLAGWLVTMKGLPTGYNKDLQEDKEAVFDAETTVERAVFVVGRILGTLRLNQDRTAAGVSGFLLATDAADYLVRRGVPFRQAHEIVATLVRRLVESGRAFESLTLADWREASPLFDEDIFERIGGVASVRAKATPQSTHPDAVAATMTELSAWIGRRRAGRQVS